MELSDYIRILRKNWLVIVATTLIGIAVAAGYSLTRTPMYEASSRVFVSTEAGGSVAELQQGGSFALQRVGTYVQLAESPLVLNPVIAELGLEGTASGLASQIPSSSPLNSFLLDISVEDADPVMAADLANAIAASLPRSEERPGGNRGGQN